MAAHFDFISFLSRPFFFFLVLGRSFFYTQGVLVEIGITLGVTCQLKLICDIDIVACKLELRSLSVIIIAVYRPPNSDFTYLQSLYYNIQQIIDSNPYSTVWVAGDINLPNINWSDNSTSGHNYPIPFCNLVLDLFNNGGLNQLVTFPTRRNNILGIFATNRPTLVNKCLPIPGISDHEAVYIETTITAKYNPPVRRKILLWSRANFQLIPQCIQDFNLKFLSNYTIESPVQQLWNDFMGMCSNCMDLVPSKFSSIRFNQPWVNSGTKQICRKKKRMYNRARLTGKESDWNKYYNLKKTAQHECRSAYSNYISSLFNPETKNKKF